MNFVYSVYTNLVSGDEKRRLFVKGKELPVNYDVFNDSSLYSIDNKTNKTSNSSVK